MEMGRMLMEYCLNAVWLVPLVAGAGWLLVKVSGLRPAGEHRVWLGALVVCVVLPGLGPSRPRVEVATRAPVVEAVQPLQVNSELDSAGSAVSLDADLAIATPEPVATPARVDTAPARREWLVRQLHEIPMAPRVVAWFGWVYAGVMGFAAFRMVRVWWAALRLVREASPYAMDEADNAIVRELAARFSVRAPRILLSERVKSPVVVGIWRTVLLLPLGFERCPQAERRAALCHELAHVQRRDCLVHAGVQVLAMPLVWHPAAHLVGRRVSRTREMVCDEMAAEAMNSSAAELTYARCLLNLARTMVREEGDALAGVGLGLFRTNKLEERVMRLTEVKRILTTREMLVRRVGGVAGAGVVLVAGAMVHVAPVVAQESAPAAPAAPTAPAAPAAPAAPTAPVAQSAPSGPLAVVVPDVPVAPTARVAVIVPDLQVALRLQRSAVSSAAKPMLAPAPAPQPLPPPPPAQATGFGPSVGQGRSFAPGTSLGAGKLFAAGPGVRFENFPGGLFRDENGTRLMVRDGDQFIAGWVQMASGMRFGMPRSLRIPRHRSGPLKRSTGASWQMPRWRSTRYRES